MKEQIQRDDDTQIYICKTLTDTAMKVCFSFLLHKASTFHTNTYKAHYLEMKIILVLWEFVLSVSYPISNMLIQQLHTWMSDEMFSVESVTLIASDVSALAS